ncbi:MAG: hypothetical protein PS018_03955 [bacterium]|nr:hypothetical protein [bacterium]
MMHADAGASALAGQDIGHGSGALDYRGGRNFLRCHSRRICLADASSARVIGGAYFAAIAQMSRAQAAIGAVATVEP